MIGQLLIDSLGLASPADQDIFFELECPSDQNMMHQTLSSWDSLCAKRIETTLVVKCLHLRALVLKGRHRRQLYQMAERLVHVAICRPSQRVTQLESALEKGSIAKRRNAGYDQSQISSCGLGFPLSCQSFSQKREAMAGVSSPHCTNRASLHTRRITSEASPSFANT